jgi:nucleoside-diphosphate-sugar epimerase
LKKNAIFDIMHGGPLWLHPSSRLQFLHTDDAARIVLELAGRHAGKETFNLCGQGTIALDDVLATLGTSVAVSPGSPTVLYDVNVEKISHEVDLPVTRDTVLRFAVGVQK